MEEMKRHIEQELSLRAGSYYLKVRNKEGRWVVISQDVSLETLAAWAQEREVAIEGRVKGGTPKKDPAKAPKGQENLPEGPMDEDGKMHKRTRETNEKAPPGTRVPPRGRALPAPTAEGPEASPPPKKALASDEPSGSPPIPERLMRISGAPREADRLPRPELSKSRDHEEAEERGPAQQGRERFDPHKHHPAHGLHE